MRRSANLSAEKLVGDYLGRVLHAAQRVLPKGDRLLFVARTRATIMKKVGPLASADLAKVQEILTDLGDPRAMAKQELERLETAHRGGPPKPVGLWRPVKDEWKPAKADTEPIPRQPAAPPPAAPPPAAQRPAGTPPNGARQPGAPPPGPRLTGPPPPAAPPVGPPPAGSPPAGRSPAAPSPAGPPSPVPPPAGSSAPGQFPAGPYPPGHPSAGHPSAGHPSAGHPSAGHPSAGHPSAGHPSAGQPPVGQPSAGQRPAGRRPPGSPAGPSQSTGPAEAGDDQPGVNLLPPAAPAPAPATVLTLARSHPLEIAAIVVLGVGGLIIPLLWLPGALVALVSRVWDARDKWLALLGTPAFLLIGLIAAGVLVGGRHGFWAEFIHAFDAYRAYLLRAGALLSAVYLAWRIRRGPRMRSLPPWQRPQRGPAG